MVVNEAVAYPPPPPQYIMKLLCSPFLSLSLNTFGILNTIFSLSWSPMYNIDYGILRVSVPSMICYTLVYGNANKTWEETRSRHTIHWVYCKLFI